MKKLILIATLLFSSIATVSARETVILAYSWTAGDKAANYYRALVDEANRLQDRYIFLFEPKPGAGGTVAAHYTLRSPNNVLWINSSAGFIRPHLFPNESHDMSKFRSILPMCISPFVISSMKYKSWTEVPKNAELTIGVSGLGTTTHLVSLQIAKNYPNMIVVPFKSTSEAFTGVLNGSIDFSVGFHGDSEYYTTKDSPRQIFWLGQTGKESVKNTELLANQGFSRDLLDMSTPQQIFAAREMLQDRFNELRKILQDAAKTTSVRTANAADNCTPNNQMPDSQLDSWFNNQAAQWQRLTTGVKITK